MPLLPKDTELQFPHQHVIPASAGSGKTYTLSHRYVQFLLSPKLHSNGLRNILAITFTKLAAKEMKERIVKILKEAALHNEKSLQELSGLISLTNNELAFHAEQLVNQILQNYSDFNVRTIDSFLTTVFKASSLELGVQPNVDIEFDSDAVIEQAFRQYSQNLREGTAEARFIDDLISLIESNESSSVEYLWNPFTKIVREVRQLQKQFSRYSSEPMIVDGVSELGRLKKSIMEKAALLQNVLEKTTLPVNNFFKKDVARLANGEVFEVASKGKTKKYFKKYSEDAGAAKEIDQIFAIVRPLEKELEQFITVYAHTYYQPFVNAVSLVEKTVQDVKQLSGSVVMDDINRSLLKYLSEDVVPEVYLKLGERIAHFMIDEFQDTSPIQWKNLYPLIEEALAKNGSLFAVGDTKQSIYSFRGGDWKIFKDLIEGKYFPSAPSVVIPLTTNYRSAQALMDFVKDVFSSNVVSAGLQEHAEASGLYNFAQEVPEPEKNKGYVEVKNFERTDDETSTLALRSYILSTIRDCASRGYSYGDIAILTPTNADVVEISSWLNQEQIPFLSLSTLDIRKRKIIGEIISLLRFLDSPIDNLSFTTFITGEVFRHTIPVITEEQKRLFIVECATNRSESYYRSFRRKFPLVWDEYFDRLFALVGYMPLYDIVSEVYKTFSIFEKCSSEESALVKFLECAKKFENSGSNSLKDFLTFSMEEGSDNWSIEVPASVHAIRIMTVHKAKGLGFPVVIVSLQERRGRANPLATIETEEGLAVIRLGKNYGERSEALGKIYNEREKEHIVDELNKIYVALTRARKEMYISVVFKKRENLPASILPEIRYGKKYPQAEKEKEEEKLPVIEPLYQKGKSVVPVAQYEKIGLEETRRGDAVHTILSNIEFLSTSIEVDLRAASQQLIIAPGIHIEHEISILLQLFSLPEVRMYFERKDGRIILREQDIVASDGRLYRMDRVVVDEHEVTVIDFKTGKDEKNDEYQEQVKNYMAMLKDIYPQKAMKGVLLYVDMKKLVEVA